MLYYLYTIFGSETGFNLFKYQTFRAMGAFCTALLISFILGPYVIRWLKSKQKGGQPIRDDGPESHILTKQGTPTMGGCLILFALTISTFLWARIDDVYVWAVMLVTLGFGGIGAFDDYKKLTKRSSKGLSARGKILFQVVISLVAALLIALVPDDNTATTLYFPFFKNLVIDLGWFYLPFAMVVLIGSSNAVNLTDGLDGLAIGPVMITAACFSIIAYVVGNAVFANYLQVTHINGAGELAIIGGALIGAGLGFLWFNAPPAMVFMGDTGSLAVGGALGAMSLVTKHEIVLGIVGGLFVVEALSVILQVGYFKYSGGKRIFLMAPIHHHFEKKGWSEPTVVFRFWIISIVLAIIGLSTLKLR